MASATEVTPMVKKSALERPENVLDVLSQNVSYSGWEKESALKQRFYVRGVSWALRRYGKLDVTDYKPFFQPAMEIIKSETSWDQQVLVPAQDKKASGSGWHEAPSYNQALRAINARKAISFHKATQIMVIFEAALRTKDGVNPLEVYSEMHIEPACYNIDDFNASALEKLRNEEDKFNSRVLAACEQSESSVLDDLTSGFTVTKSTAEGIKKFVDEECGGKGLGDIRHRPGRSLGKKKASGSEKVV